MNINQMKGMLAKFRSADVSVIKDDAMRAKAQKLQAKQKGFTLLELLVVVAILAIIAGAVISSMDGKEERAAQATTVHTMAALENGVKIYSVSEKRTLPGNLESLLCSSTLTPTSSGGLSFATGDVSGALLSNKGSNSNVSRIDGGLTNDLADKLTVVSVDNDGDLLQNLIGAGLTSVRYVAGDVCAKGDGDGVTFAVDTFEGQTSAVTSKKLVDVVKPNLIFRAPYGEDNDWEYGAGKAVKLDTANAYAMAFYDEPGDLGRDEEEIIAVFGVGPDSSLIGEIIGKAPSDGNVGPDKYGHYSVAVSLGECQKPDAELDGFIADLAANNVDACDLDQDIEIIGIIDGGGDGYDDEIAEARGNQEE